MTTDSKPIPNYARFILGGCAGIAATCLTQPLDLLKNRMQMSGVGDKTKAYSSSFHALEEIVAREGVLELYNGLSAGVLRQATYTTARMGVYSFLVDLSKKDEQPISFPVRALCGVTAGMAAAFVGTPADVAMIRMTSDGRLPASERHNYRHVGDALARITREEGIVGLWTGVLPTMGRAMVVNGVQLSSYSQTKQQLIRSGLVNDNIFCHFWASMFAGFVTTVASMPIDIAKTRIQNMKTVNGQPEYSGMVDVMANVVRHEGVPALWKGFTPYFARLGPHTVLTFIFLEQFTKLYVRYVLGDTSGKGSGF